MQAIVEYLRSIISSIDRESGSTGSAGPPRIDGLPKSKYSDVHQIVNLRYKDYDGKISVKLKSFQAEIEKDHNELTFDASHEYLQHTDGYRIVNLVVLKINSGTQLFDLLTEARIIKPHFPSPSFIKYNIESKKELRSLAETLGHDYNILMNDILSERTEENKSKWYQSQEGKRAKGPRCWGSADVAMFTQLVREIPKLLVISKRVNQDLKSSLNIIPNDIIKMISGYLVCGGSVDEGSVVGTLGRDAREDNHLKKAINLANQMIGESLSNVRDHLLLYIDVDDGSDDAMFISICTTEMITINLMSIIISRNFDTLDDAKKVLFIKYPQLEEYRYDQALKSSVVYFVHANIPTIKEYQSIVE